MDNDTRKLLGITDPNIKFSDHWLESVKMFCKKGNFARMNWQF